MTMDRRAVPRPAGGARGLWPRRAAAERGVAIDFGTSCVRIAGFGRLLVEEPTVVVRHSGGGIIAVGGEARNVAGRNPQRIDVIEPVEGATITDIDVAEALLQRLLRRAGIAGTRLPVVVAVPLVAEGLHRRALLQCVQRALPKATLVPLEAPMAAAIGSRLPVQEAFGTMIVDVGRGITEAAVLSLGTMITSAVAPVGGAAAAAAVTDHLAQRHDLEIGPHTAERAVRFSARTRSGAVFVRGNHRPTGLPRGAQMTSTETRAVLHPVLESIAMVAKNALDAAPAALAADVMQGQIVVTGGASKLEGLAGVIEDRTGIEVRIRDCPERSVIDGAELCLRSSALLASPYE